VRDRDRLRGEHLQRLGWSFHRLWSTNWFADPRGEVAKVRDAYQRAVDAAEPTVPDEPEPPVQAPGQSVDVVRRI
jgi:REase_MTES_1575